MDRTTEIMVVTVALVISGVAHFLVAGTIEQWSFGIWRGRPVKVSAISQPDVGQEESDLETSVAWISYADYRELVAPKSVVRQPAVQKEVIPVPDAPPIVIAGAKPSVAVAVPAKSVVKPTPKKPAASPQKAPDPKSPAKVEAPTPKQEPKKDPQLALVVPTGGKTEFKLPGKESAKKTEKTAEKVAPKSSTVPKKPAPAQVKDKPGSPTSAPKSDKESPARQLEVTFGPMSPGEVLTAKGITVKPMARIRTLSTAAEFEVPKRNPVVRITFGPDGDVIDAELVTSIGAPGLDLALLTYLYKWKASGGNLKSLDKYIIIVPMIIWKELELPKPPKPKKSNDA